jgi:AraC-like DNA-binding protein
MTVKQARLEVGLLDHSSFAKSYKKYFGETPTNTKRSASGKWKSMLLAAADGDSSQMGSLV